MRLLADLHIAPRTVAYLCDLGHDAIRVPDVLPCNASDREIVAKAAELDRVIVTQDLDFSAIVALSGSRRPSVVSVRLSTADVDHLNPILATTLDATSQALENGAIVTIQDGGHRVRRLPVE